MATLKVTNIRNESFAGDQLYLKTDGKIGIGTTAPDQMLHIKGNTPYIKFEDDNDNQDWQIEARAFFSIYDVNDSLHRLVIDGSGNIGIGTTSPEDLLHIKTGKIRIENAIVSNNDSTISYDNSDFLIDVDPNNVRGSSKFQIKVDTVAGLTIDDNRRVGIGTTSPASILHVESSSPSIRFVDTDASGGFGMVGVNNTSGSLVMRSDDQNALANSYMGFEVDGGTKMYIKSDGKVGIGTTSPSELLHVNGTASISYLNVSAGGLTAGQKVVIAGSGNNSGDDLNINNWGNADGDYWVIGTNITSNAGGSVAKINNTNRSASILLGGRMGRMILQTSQGGTATIDDTHTWDKDGNYTLTGNVVVANGKGIDFSATSDGSGSMSSELLDDYEEGTFTPTATVEGESAASTDKNYGRYIKTGKKVTVWCYVQLNGTPSNRANNKAWQHGGLPFTHVNVASGFDVAGTMLHWTLDSNSGLTGTAPYTLVPRLFNNATGGRIRAIGSDANQTGTNASLLMKDNTEYSYTLTYETA